MPIAVPTAVSLLGSDHFFHCSRVGIIVPNLYLPNALGISGQRQRSHHSLAPPQPQDGRSGRTGAPAAGPLHPLVGRHPNSRPHGYGDSPRHRLSRRKPFRSRAGAQGHVAGRRNPTRVGGRAAEG